MSVVNGKALLALSPIKGMFDSKQKAQKTSFGLSEVGYDVRIKQGLQFMRDGNGNKVTLVESNGVVQRQIGWAVLVNVAEEFTMPPTLVGVGLPKSTWNRHHVRLGSPVIEPGWNGFLTISLDYRGEETLLIPPGEGIMQVIFHAIGEEAAYAGRYQNQGNEIVGSKPV